MKKALLLANLTLCLVLLPCLLPAQLQEDGSINIVPHWSKDDQFSLKIKTTSTDSSDEKKTITHSVFDAVITVIESNNEHTKFEWIYTNAKIDDKERLVENLVLRKFTNKKINVQLDDAGQFAGLLNYDELKGEVEKIIDVCLKEFASDETIVAQLRSYKQLIKTTLGFEAAILKHVKIYLFSFGDNYKQKQVKTNQLKIPNPIGGPPLDAIENVQLIAIDKTKSVCVIETKKNVEGDALKNSVISFLKKNYPGNDAEIENELKNQKLDFSEKTQHQINYEKGIPLKATFERITKLGFQNRIYLLEIQTAN